MIDSIKRKGTQVLAAAAIALSASAAQAAPTTALYLVMDGSGSIDAAEFTTQINGYVAALNGFFANNPTAYGQVAIGGSIFGGNSSEFFATQSIDDAADLAALTAAIAALNPGRGGINTGATAIGNAITAASNALVAFQGQANLNLVIDVTTDGANNLGPAPGPVADALTPGTIDAVNCLGIEFASACDWVGTSGTDYGNVTFADLAAALENKIKLETIGVPEPMSLALFGLGLAGLGVVARRKLAA
jgi:hypothetical protein